MNSLPSALMGLSRDEARDMIDRMRQLCRKRLGARLATDAQETARLNDAPRRSTASYTGEFFSSRAEPARAGLRRWI